MSLTVVIALALAAPLAPPALERGVEAIKGFRVDEGLALLEEARRGGPFGHDELVLLHEQLGIGYAYAGRTDEAFAEFLRVMAIAPGHALSYTLSPKVTFVYERARQTARRRPAPTLELSYERATFATEPLPLLVSLSAAAPVLEVGLFARRHGAAQWEARRARLDEARVARFELPPLTAEESPTRELFAVAYDAVGNEVLQLASRDAPRELTLGHDPRPRWYQRWYVWVASVAVVAATAALTVYLATRPAPREVPATFSVTTF